MSDSFQLPSATYPSPFPQHHRGQQPHHQNHHHRQHETRMVNQEEAATANNGSYRGHRNGGYEDIDDKHHDFDDDDLEDDEYGNDDYAASLPHPDEVFIERKASRRRNTNTYGEVANDTHDEQPSRLLGAVCIVVMLSAVAVLIVGVTVRVTGGRGLSILETSTPVPSSGTPTLSPTVPVTRDIEVVPRHGFDWRQMGSDINGQYPNGAFGYSVSLSFAGYHMAVSSPFLGASEVFEDSDEESAPSTFPGLVQVYSWEDEDNTWLPLGNDIIGDAGAHQTGYTVSISESGKRLALASAFEHGAHVRVYEDREIAQNVAAWEPIGQALGTTPFTYEEEDPPRVNATNGYSKSHGQHFVMSGNGNCIAIGGDEVSVPTRVLQESGKVWEPLGRSLDLDFFAKDQDSNETNSFRHVALSSDGHRVAVSSPRCPGHDRSQLGSGVINVFQYSAMEKVWERLGDPLFGLDGYCSMLNNGLALSGDGSILAAVGMRYRDGYDPNSTIVPPSVLPFIRTYRFESGSWNQYGKDIIVETSIIYLGFSLSLDFTGKRMAIGTVQFHNLPQRGFGMPQQEYVHKGVVHVYQFGRGNEAETDIDATWRLLGSRIRGRQTGDMAGWSVSISGDGHTVAIGAPFNDIDGHMSEAGHVRVFQFVQT